MQSWLSLSCFIITMNIILNHIKSNQITSCQVMQIMWLSRMDTASCSHHAFMFGYILWDYGGLWYDRVSWLNFINFMSESKTSRSSLPYLLPQRGGRESKAHPSHSYLTSLSAITLPIQYEGKNANFVKGEQRRLKQVLRQMNDVTGKMVQGVKISRDVRRGARSHQVRQKQLENNEQVINMCRKEMQNLQNTYNSIIQADSVPVLYAQINKIEGELTNMRQFIHSEKLRINMTGKQLIEAEREDYQYAELKKMENQKDAGEKKREKLRKEDFKVATEIKKIQISMEQLQKKEKQLTKGMEEVKEDTQHTLEDKKLQYLITQKKIAISALTKKITTLKSQANFKYYRALHALSILTTSLGQINTRIDAVDLQNLMLRKEVDRLEREEEVIKKQNGSKGKRVRQFLDRGGGGNIKTYRHTSERAIINNPQFKHLQTQELELELPRDHVRNQPSLLSNSPSEPVQIVEAIPNEYQINSSPTPVVQE